MILILYVESGSGSLTLAKNIQQELNSRGVENRLVSLHELLPSTINDVLFGNYRSWCINNKKYFTPLYRSRWFYPILYKLLSLIIRWRGQDKDVSFSFAGVKSVICCSFFCSWFAHYWRRKNSRKYAIYGVLGDYTVSPGWQLKIDKLFIPFDFPNPVFDFIRRQGGEIMVSGVPVTYYQTEIVQVKGSVLICGGGWGLQITAETIAELLAQKNITQLIVLCGQNSDLFNELNLQFRDKVRGGKLELHGFTHDMHSLYARAEIVVTKAGGLTLTEAATYCKPIIITGYLPGHEKENMKVFVQRGAAIFAVDRKRLIQAVDTILMDGDSADSMRVNAAALVNKHACNLLCNEILKDEKYVDA